MAETTQPLAPAWFDPNALLDLIDELRAAGYNIDLTHYMAAQDLLLALAARGATFDPPQRLQGLLGPLLCSSPAEQAEFPHHFDRWAARLVYLTVVTPILAAPTPFPAVPTPLPTVSVGDLEEELVTIDRQARWGRRVMIGIYILLLSSLLTSSHPPRRGVVPARTPVAAVATVQINPIEPTSAPTTVPLTATPVQDKPVTPILSLFEQVIHRWWRWQTLVAVILFLIPLLVWRLWWFYRAHLFLARHATTQIPELESVVVQSSTTTLFSPLALFRLAQGLRRRVEIPSHELDIEATLTATIQYASWFTPVYGHRRVVPEYLILVDRAHYHDHQARLVEELVQRLRVYEVLITLYAFDGDPRICFPLTGKGAPLTLRDLATKHPDQRLILFADASHFFNPFTGALEPWIAQLERWSERALLTPDVPTNWGYREQELAEQFSVLSATPAGLAQLVQSFTQPILATAADELPQARLPEVLRTRPLRWLERQPPEPALVETLMADLRVYLDEASFTWLCACAVYPTIDWNLTLYLGHALQTDEKFPYLESGRLLTLARLPWLRYAYMPDWLRGRLLKSLPRPQERAIRFALQTLLVTAVQGTLNDFELEIVRKNRRGLRALAKPLLRLLVLKAAEESSLRDYVFLQFMTGHTRNPLVLQLPEASLELFDSTPQPLLTKSLEQPELSPPQEQHGGVVLQSSVAQSRPQFCPECGTLIRRAAAIFCSTCGKHLPQHVPLSLAVPPTLQPIGTIRLADRPDLLNLAAFTIGRDPAQNQLPLDHLDISQVHARVEWNAYGHSIQDLGSSNGTFINGQYLQGVHPLQRGDVIHIGPYKLVYDQGHLSQPILSTGYRLDANALGRTIEIGFWRRRKIQILKAVSLSVKPGEFIALVGGSGSGKSTLMKALSGFFPADQGQVMLNGDNLYTNFAAYRSLLGYVPQDDIIHGQLPVRNALTYAARLRLPDATHAEIESRIDKVLDQVEMQTHAQKIVSQLSGGQRKRVSIGVELLAEPAVFFLDDPTSGLDPGLEKKMMQTMRTLADGGRTVLLVTHATANINLCHQVAFLAEGHLAYYGPPKGAQQFFGQPEFSDIYNTLAAPGAGAQWAQRFDQSQHPQAIRASSPTSPSLTKPRSPRVSTFHQFAVLVQRALELIWHDWSSLAMLLLVMPLIGGLLLLMVNAQDLVGKAPDEVATEIQTAIADQKAMQDATLTNELFLSSYTVVGSAQKILLILALAVNLLGIFAAAYEIVKEESIYQRERMVNLKIWPYLLSKIVVLGIFGALQCVLLIFVIGLGLEYPAAGVLLDARMEMFITLFLATLASICLGLLISAAVSSRNTVIYLILLVFFIQIVFAGALFKLEGATFISYFTTTRWTLEALGSTVNMDALNQQGVSCIEFEALPPVSVANAGNNSPCTDEQTKITVDFEFHIDYTSSRNHLLLRWLILIGFAVGFSLLTYLVQRRKDVV